MNRGHIPERTCRSCGRKNQQSGLLRFVVIGGRLVEGHLESMTGRGIYCCKEGACRERLSRNKKVLKAD